MASSIPLTYHAVAMVSVLAIELFRGGASKPNGVHAHLTCGRSEIDPCQIATRDFCN